MNTYIVIFSNGYQHRFENVDKNFIEAEALRFCETTKTTCEFFKLTAKVNATPVHEKQFENANHN